MLNGLERWSYKQCLVQQRKFTLNIDQLALSEISLVARITQKSRRGTEKVAYELSEK